MRYQPQAGEEIGETARRMIALAAESKETVEATFLGIPLLVEEGNSADQIVGVYQYAHERRFKSLFRALTSVRAVEVGETLELELFPGPKIETIAKHMIILAVLFEKTVTANFNGIILTAKEGDTAQGIVDFYRGECECRSERYSAQF